MSTPVSRPLAAAAGAFLLLAGACAGGSSSSNAVSDKTPVAKVGDKTITNAELSQSLKGKLTKAEREFQQQVYQIKSQALDELVDTRLVEAKAKAEGITPEALKKREVDDKMATTDAEVLAFYEEAKARRPPNAPPMPPFEQVKDQAAGALKKKKEAEVKAKFYEKLRADAKVELLLPPLRIEVAAEGPSKGDPKAPVTIVEFSDFQCPYCTRVEPTMKQVLETYKGKVRLVYREFPLAFHDKAPKASQAALCAGDQGKYWEMHEKLFANQQALDVPQLKEHAKGIVGDQAKYEKCLDSNEKKKVVDESLKVGEEAGVTGTPAFFINGRFLSGAQPFENFKKIIDDELARKS